MGYINASNLQMCIRPFLPQPMSAAPIHETHAPVGPEAGNGTRGLSADSQPSETPWRKSFPPASSPIATEPSFFLRQRMNRGHRPISRKITVAGYRSRVVRSSRQSEIRLCRSCIEERSNRENIKRVVESPTLLQRSNLALHSNTPH